MAYSNGDKIIKLAATLTLAAALTQPAQASRKGWADASDVGVYSLMAASIAIPAIEGDGKGVLQAAGSVGAAALVTEGLKETFPTLRPDGSDRRSFPSGHTSRSFAAAATLWQRQGKEIGIPAMAIAGMVGVARMKADKHRFGEVAVGAAIGLASGILITNKRKDSNSALVPWTDGKGGGISFAMRF
jgi:membrane-associated phospholipid phosphatase